MSTVNNAIKAGLLGYPSLFATPAGVLHQLFIVNGNGYKWKGGQLVAWNESREDADAWLQESLDEANGEGLRLYYEEMQHRYQWTKANIARIVEHGERRYRGSIYPLCEYAKIVCVPDDVQDDWLQEAYWFAENLCVAIRMRQHDPHERDARHLAWLQRLARKFDDMLIARGLHSTREARDQLVEQVLTELKAEKP